MKKLKALKKFYEKYERYLIPGALIFGFVTDVLTFRFLNFPLAMTLLAGHLTLIGANIFIINLYEAKKIAGKFFSYWRVLAPLLLQYSFGNLFSAFLIFYSHSGSFFASWPFIIVIIFLMIGNEVFRKYNIRPSIQISVYFFALFSYLNLLLPNLFKDISIFIFLLSSLLSVIYIATFTHILSSLTEQVRNKKRIITTAVVSIFLAVNAFYFLNLIPPIPLSLRDVGVYHEIKRDNDNYIVTTEDCGNFLTCLFYHEKRHIKADRQKIYLYSAIYAPDEMELNVTHEWRKKNEQTNRWETVATIPFSVDGGRDIGYRWYTFYTTPPGQWRVDIKTEKGQIIGVKNFYIIKGEEDRLQKKI